MRPDLGTSEPQESYSENRTMERSLKTELQVQWSCPYVSLEHNPFTYTVGRGAHRGAAVVGLQSIHRNKAEQLLYGQLFPHEKALGKK